MVVTMCMVDHNHWLPRRPSVQRDVTKQFIRKHALKDPYPGAPYKVLPEFADKYNLVTEVSDCHYIYCIIIITMVTIVIQSTSSSRF